LRAPEGFVSKSLKGAATVGKRNPAVRRQASSPSNLADGSLQRVQNVHVREYGFLRSACQQVHPETDAHATATHRSIYLFMRTNDTKLWPLIKQILHITICPNHTENNLDPNQGAILHDRKN
jgi:hypothetical protein